MATALPPKKAFSIMREETMHGCCDGLFVEQFEEPAAHSACYLSVVESKK